MSMNRHRLLVMSSWGNGASVWMNAVVRGDVNAIRIGAGSNVQDCAVLHGDARPVSGGDRGAVHDRA